MSESLEGVLERIVFSNEESGFCIGELRPRHSKESITLAGKMPNVQCGETLTLQGHWKHHPQYGRQFSVQDYSTKLPSDVYGIKKYLGSGLVPGIGKSYADKIVNHFQEKTLHIISHESKKLQEIPGIGKQRASSIKKSWDAQQSQRSVMVFLQTYGISPNLCRRLVQKFGSQADQIIKEEPYRLAMEFKGIGFKKADQIALNLGFPNQSETRIHAGLIYLLQQAEQEGHTTLLREELWEQSVALLDIDAQLIKEAINQALQQSLLSAAIDPHYLQIPALTRAEQGIAQHLLRLQQTPSALPSIIIPKAIHWSEEKAQFSFAPLQKDAIAQALTHKISILTGGPGTGKTTILRALNEILRAKKVKVVQAAPTGRAAQRMSEATKQYAQTLHRLLKMDPSAGHFTVNQDNPLRGDFFIVDESSMLDTRLFHAFIRAIPNDASLLIVGDSNQLPSVGSGAILADLIACGQLPTIRLETIFRQKQGNSIVYVADSIRQGFAKAPQPESNSALASDGLHFIEESDPQRIEKLIADIYQNCRQQSDSPTHTQVLIPMRRGQSGIHNTNAYLQNALNPDGITVFNSQPPLRLGDKVIQTKNNYDKNIFNGDIGTIVHHSPSENLITLSFGYKEVELEATECLDLQLAYAMSVHKSQGSEFHTVILVLLKQHFVMLQRNLLYTAVTRGKKRVIVIGEKQAWSMAVMQAQSQERQTLLQEAIANQ